MKLSLSTALAAAALALAACNNAPTPGSVTPKTDEEKFAYAFGMAFQKNAETLSLTPAEIDMAMAGFRDAAAGKAALKLEEAMPILQKTAMERQRGAMEKQRAEAEKKGAEKAKVLTEATPAYLEKAAKEPGAEKTASGLIYVKVKDGAGASPTAADNVKVHYTGKLVDGTVFDSSVQRGQPITFQLGQLIPCWIEGIQKMKVGGKARLVCPAALAYGEQNKPGIPPGSVLDFEVELLEIVKK